MEWRRYSLAAGLQRYRYRAMDKLTHDWLDRWIANTQHNSLHKVLAPHMDNSDDFSHLRSQDYVKDDMLKFCDPKRHTRLCLHLLFALLYEREISALRGGRTTPSSTPEKLQLHLGLPLSNDRYKRAIYTPNNRSHWEALRIFICG